MKSKLPKSFFNMISIIGAILALFTFTMILLLFLAGILLDIGSTYLGLLTYIILPPFLIIGLLLIPIGMYWKNKRVKRKGEVDKKTFWDLLDHKQRNAAFIFVIGTFLLIFLTSIGSYEAFHITESVTFCGEMCHDVMAPEYTAYKNSPHAQVACVECHVGEGVDWYVKSKLSGAYQLYAVTFDTYPRPIPTPIKNLRPARETCEKCHWPEKFYSQTVRLEKHYLADSANTEWLINLVLKIGGEHSSAGLEEGIHWHVNPNIKVEYTASDKRRQNIEEVRYIDLTNNDTIIYKNDFTELEEDSLASLSAREMDCMDCHNRPSHNYLSPNKFINYKIAEGSIPKEIPEIKSVLMSYCEEDAASIDSLKEAVDKGVNEFYQNNYPEFASRNTKMINKSIAAFNEAYSKNIFPKMKVKWSAYPSNIGHMEFKGCFRCHNTNMVNDEGENISNDCNLCHYINAQGKRDSLVSAQYNESLDFQHPVDIFEAWREMPCSDCHNGLLP